MAAKPSPAPAPAPASAPASALSAQARVVEKVLACAEHPVSSRAALVLSLRKHLDRLLMNTSVYQASDAIVDDSVPLRDARGRRLELAPLHCCALSRHGDDIVALLVDTFGATVNITNPKGWTPLNVALSLGNIAVAQALVARGASPLEGTRPPVDAVSTRLARLLLPPPVPQTRSPTTHTRSRRRRRQRRRRRAEDDGDMFFGEIELDNDQEEDVDEGDDDDEGDDITLSSDDDDDDGGGVNIEDTNIQPPPHGDFEGVPASLGSTGSYGSYGALASPLKHRAYSEQNAETSAGAQDDDGRGDANGHTSRGVFSWGNGANYQLGSGYLGVTRSAGRVEVANDEKRQPIDAATISASKYASAMVTTDGRLFTWGFGRGGRLGHDLLRSSSSDGIAGVFGSSASKNSALESPNTFVVLYPRQVDFDENAVPRSLHTHVRIARVSMGKHHALACTFACDGGDVYSWGNNMHGRLGMPVASSMAAFSSSPANASFSPQTTMQNHPDDETACSMRVTPGRVSSSALASCVAVEVCAANKHSVVLTDDGQVFTFGCNEHRQLGYVLFDPRDCRTELRYCHVPHRVEFAIGESPLPTRVASMDAPRLCRVAASKRHTVVLNGRGDIFCWGGSATRASITAGTSDAAATRELVRRVQVPPLGHSSPSAASASKNDDGGWQRARGGADVEYPKFVHVAAGLAHSVALTDDGVAYMWRSGDDKPQAKPIAARLATITPPGMEQRRFSDVSMGKFRGVLVDASGDVLLFESPRPRQRRGSAGGDDNDYTPQTPPTSSAIVVSVPDGRIDDDLARITFERVRGLKRVTRVSVGEKHSLALQAIWYPHVPTAQEHEQGTLRSLAEDAVMRSITEPRAAMDALEYAYYLDSERLWKLCAGVVLGNLDAVLSSAHGLASFRDADTDALRQLEGEVHGDAAACWCQTDNRSRAEKARVLIPEDLALPLKVAVDERSSSSITSTSSTIPAPVSSSYPPPVQLQTMPMPSSPSSAATPPTQSSPPLSRNARRRMKKKEAAATGVHGSLSAAFASPLKPTKSADEVTTTTNIYAAMSPVQPQAPSTPKAPPSTSSTTSSPLTPVSAPSGGSGKPPSPARGGGGGGGSGKKKLAKGSLTSFLTGELERKARPRSMPASGFPSPIRGWEPSAAIGSTSSEKAAVSASSNATTPKATPKRSLLDIQREQSAEEERRRVEAERERQRTSVRALANKSKDKVRVWVGSDAASKAHVPSLAKHLLKAERQRQRCERAGFPQLGSSSSSAPSDTPWRAKQSVWGLVGGEESANFPALGAS
ncbi:hypothetical protein RI054_31g122720 [Pseudoscourfieldia marina]